MSFCDNLQHLRSSRTMTQEQLAVLAGVSRQSVTKWEAERACPEMDKLFKLCQIFDCSLDDPVSGDFTDERKERLVADRCIPRATGPARWPASSGPLAHRRHRLRHRRRLDRRPGGVGVHACWVRVLWIHTHPHGLQGPYRFCLLRR